MDSINKNQPEHNMENLSGAKAIKKMADLIKEAETCFFCTNLKSGDVDARPMSVLQVDEQGNLWFMSASDSHKNAELQTDSSVRLFFQGSPHSEFLHLEGTATISRDKAKIHELWKFVLKTWFTEGEDDPRITVIKVTPSHGYYWDTKHGNAVAGVKMMIGAAVGVTLDDSIEGNLNP
jgi:general stress protein 26